MKNLYDELKAYRRCGVSLWLDGRESTPEEIVCAYFIADEEKPDYMRDYVRNARGEVEKVEFDRVDRDK